MYPIEKGCFLFIPVGTVFIHAYIFFVVPPPRARSKDPHDVVYLYLSAFPPQQLDFDANHFHRPWKTNLRPLLLKTTSVTYTLS